jgi:2-oxopent-4-enoate/cis-2-oxohex-4-enoate hydratase
MTPIETGSKQTHGDELYDAYNARHPVAPLTDRDAPDITIDDAYRIQERFVERRVDGRRDHHRQEDRRDQQAGAGHSWACISRTSAAHLRHGLHRRRRHRPEQLIQPKAEAELAFVLKRDLKSAPASPRPT